MIRPNEQTNTHVTSNLQATFSPKFDIAASGQGTYQLTRNDGNGLGIGLVGLSDALGPWDTLSYLPAEAQRTRMTTSTKRGVGTANARLQAFPWAVLNGTAGLDYALRDDQMLTRAQDCTSALNASGFVDDIQRYGGQLTFRFHPRGAEPATANLVAGVDGRWTGELVSGKNRSMVTLRRN